MEDIGFYPDNEIHDRLQAVKDHPMMQKLLQFCFPDKEQATIHSIVDNCHSTRDFHANILYPGVQQLLQRTSGGFTTSGFDQLEKDHPYLYISNHRDIALDTTLTNYALLENELIMTASAIGDNLVQHPFLLQFAKINRNFLVLRKLSPREMLIASRRLSLFINELITKAHHSVWIAQREGRAKDGNDTTHQGVLKMLSLAKERDESIFEYFQKLSIVPLSISYEWDPNDQLKLKELATKAKGQSYQKTENEDFHSILAGILGYKGRIHLHAGTPLHTDLKALSANGEGDNKQLQQLTQLLDEKIQEQYHLWPSNYIAYDLLHQTDQYIDQYTAVEKATFVERYQQTTKEDQTHQEIFLKMYANPLSNRNKITAAEHK